MENIFWEGFTNGERHTAINQIKSVVSKYSDLVDIRLFSDISINLTIEIEEFKIDHLHEELNKIIGVQKTENFDSKSKKERTIYLNITFSKGTGNVKVEVPSVPG